MHDSRIRLLPANGKGKSPKPLMPNEKEAEMEAEAAQRLNPVERRIIVDRYEDGVSPVVLARRRDRKPLFIHACVRQELKDRRRQIAYLRSLLKGEMPAVQGGAYVPSDRVIRCRPDAVAMERRAA